MSGERLWCCGWLRRSRNHNKAVEKFVPFLEEAASTWKVVNSLAVYADPETMSSVRLMCRTGRRATSLLISSRDSRRAVRRECGTRGAARRSVRPRSAISAYQFMNGRSVAGPPER